MSCARTSTPRPGRPSTTRKDQEQEARKSVREWCSAPPSPAAASERAMKGTARASAFAFAPTTALAPPLYPPSSLLLTVLGGAYRIASRPLQLRACPHPAAAAVPFCDCCSPPLYRFGVSWPRASRCASLSLLPSGALCLSLRWERTAASQHRMSCEGKPSSWPWPPRTPPSCSATLPIDYFAGSGRLDDLALSQQPCF